MLSANSEILTPGECGGFPFRCHELPFQVSCAADSFAGVPPVAVQKLEASVGAADEVKNNGRTTGKMEDEDPLHGAE